MKMTKEALIRTLRSDREYVLSLIEEDLEIKVDNECSNLYDEVSDKFLDVNFETIIDKTIERVINVIESFK